MMDVLEQERQRQRREKREQQTQKKREAENAKSWEARRKKWDALTEAYRLSGQDEQACMRS
jgi:hypothetical protein